MASDDYYTHLARQQIQKLDANRAQVLADLEYAKANADYDSAGAAVQQLADLEAQKANVVNLHNQYLASQQPYEPPPLSAEEKAARPIEKMSHDELFEMANKTTKLGCDPDYYRAGMAEVQRRRQNGG